MSNLFNRLRSGAERTAGKAAFEADKLRRVTSLQATMRSLKSELKRAISQTGQTAFSLYQKEQISEPIALRQACERLAVIEANILATEQEIEAIRAEAFVEKAIPLHSRICPDGHGQIAYQDNFCQVCGAQVVDVPPTSEICPHCKSPLLPNAVFCTECGQKMVSRENELSSLAADVPETIDVNAASHEETMNELDSIIESVEEMTVAEDDLIDHVQTQSKPDELGACSVCDAPLIADATFCIECGSQLDRKGDIYE